MSRLSKKHCPIPEDFATKILDLEMKIQEKCVVQDINSIVGLYSSAIEFYESLNDPIYQVYQKRLQNVLSKKSVLAVLSPKPKPVPRSPLFDFNSPTNRLAEQRKVENTLKMHSIESHNTLQLAKKNIKQQEDTFENKLRTRRNSRSRPGSRENSIERPNLENFEKALEKLLEKLVTERLKKIESIDLKYEKIIGRSKEFGDLAKVKELEQDKGKEIKELMGKLEIERKLEISALKNRFASV